MEIPVLKVEQRKTKGKGYALRTRCRGMIPAVCYGKGEKSLSLNVDPKELTGVLRGPRGLNSLIKLDGAEDRMVFVQELQTDPVDRNLLHVDFLSVDTKKKVQRHVPLNFTGRAVGYIQGGLLQMARRQLMVEALPTQLPEEIVIDITPMDIGDIKHVADLDMPEGVKAVYERNFTICAITAPIAEEKTEEEEEPAEGEGTEDASPETSEE
jgi:large subunit ribosomal protein L25